MVIGSSATWCNGMRKICWFKVEIYCLVILAFGLFAGIHTFKIRRALDVFDYRFGLCTAAKHTLAYKYVKFNA